jgi:hypothetical protein
LNRIITDNGSQFTSSAFQGYYEDLSIKICYASITHTESNGQVERANVEILKGLKTCTYDGLIKYGKKWIDELPCTLWGNQTSPSRATRETPFFMVYGDEVVLPPKVTMGWAPYVSRHTTKLRRTSFGARILTSSMKEDGNLLLKMHGTARHSNSTKSSLCAVESSRWTIWCSGGCSLEKELTSSPLAGRAPSV